METCTLAYIAVAGMNLANPGPDVLVITTQAIHAFKPTIPIGPTTPGTAWLASASGYGAGAPEHLTCVSPDGYQFIISGTGYRLGEAVGGIWTGPHATQGTWIDRSPGTDWPVMKAATGPAVAIASLSESRAAHAVANYAVAAGNRYNNNSNSVGKMTDVTVTCYYRVSATKWSCSARIAVTGRPGCPKLAQGFYATLEPNGSVNVTASTRGRTCVQG